MELNQPNNILKESPDPEDEEQQFEWDYKYIFKEARKPEVVALAQPLAAIFTTEMTPVPQIDIRSTRSVSRHARAENLKEFIRSIRDAAQWSFAQEDPAFAELKTECPLIPIEKVPAWIAKRQGLNENLEVEASRKRAWSNEQDDIDDQIALEVGEDTAEEPRSIKRQKNEEDMGKDAHMTEVVAKEDVPAPGTPCLESPMLKAAGTSGVEDSDDAWAPEPGEVGSISSPADQTEALLASLGVTGEAKPPKSESLPPNNPPEKEISGTFESPQTQPQVTGFPASAPIPPNQADYNSHQSPPLMSQPNQMSQGIPQAGPQSGPANNPQYGGNQTPIAPYQNEPYGPQRSSSWNNGPPNNQAFGGSQQGNHTNYGPPVNQSYQGGPQGPMYNQQYGPQRSTSYPNPQYGPPQWNNSQQPNSQYGYGGSPPEQNGQFYGQQQYNSYVQPPVQGQQPYNSQGSPPAQFGGPQYSNSQYVNPSPQGPPQWNNGQQQYGNAPPYGPPQYPSGPPIQQQYGNVPQGPPQYTNGPGMQQPYNTQQGPPQFINGSQMPNGHLSQSQPQYNGLPPNQQQFNNYQQNPPQQHGPMQQNPSMQQNGQMQQGGSMQQNGPMQQNGLQMQNGQHSGIVRQDGQKQNGSPYDHAPVRQDSGYMSARGSYSNGTGQSGFQAGSQIAQSGQSAPTKQENQSGKSGTENELPEEVERDASESEPGTPLSPTSAEILGKLRPGSKRKASGDESRKAKRPQPVVAEAYR